MEVSRESLLKGLEELRPPREPSECVEEAEHLARLLAILEVRDKLALYSSPVVVGIGGSGIILRALHTLSGIHHAIKLPRAPILKKALKGDSAEVDPELAALAKISHQHITRLYDSFRIPDTSLHCVITQYVPEHLSLDDYAFQLFSGPPRRKSIKQLSEALGQLAEVIYSIVEAVEYMHSTARLLHFDLKPENILVTPDHVPFVTDLGFARELKGYDPDEMVSVGFTWKYAHPRLTKPHDGARVSRVAEKSKISIRGRELSPIFDVFAFGRTLQQVLQRLNVEYGEQIQSQYIFNYLHLVACLCLDGFNSRTDDEEDFISDSAMGLPVKMFGRNKFEDFSGIKSCLGRLVGRYRIEDLLPETDRWIGSTIKVSDFGSTTLTPRVQALINHPALLRLKREKQLGMLDSVFPTANHTRYQHSLGVYHAMTQYISALYYDPDNPIFRVLFDAEQCSTALVGALCHDLGQTAYGHELEEVDKDEFDHKRLVQPIIESTAFRSPDGRSLRSMIEGAGDDEWSLPLSRVTDFISGRGLERHSLGRILHDMIDSQIDADKFDYLIRDSVECRVTYGLAIDHERFLRSLTTHVDGDGSLRLAVKQKGAASAEAFIQARYQLYQSLYWHHTFRATKAMLLEAVRIIIGDLRAANSQAELFYKDALAEAYARHVIGIELKAAPEAGKDHKKTVGGARQLIEARLQAARSANLQVPYDTDLTMKFLWGVSSGKARSLLEDLVERRYYKRVYETSPSRLSPARWERLRKQFQNLETRGEMQDELESQLYNTIRGVLQSRSDVVMSLQVDGALDEFESLAARKRLFLIDMPLRGWYAADEAPVYVSDYKRRHFRASAASSGGVERREDFWIKTMGELMKGIAYVRVFCDAEVHPLVTRVVSGQDISDAIYRAVPDLKD